LEFKLEIGSGKSPRPGYSTCDVRDIEGVDYVCEAHDLPFEDQSVDEVYSRHLVEHLTFREFLTTLKEWNRVLKPGGSIYIVCPHLLWHLRQILDGSHESFMIKDRGSNDRYWGMGSLFGWQQDQYDVHQFGYYPELMRDILQDFGFADVQDLTNMPDSLEKAPWHLEIQATKVSEATDPSESKYFNHFMVKH
jgi:predicted SAM-dependent methyltransferase